MNVGRKGAAGARTNSTALRRLLIALAGGTALTLAVPLVAGRSPTSLLPPGFSADPAPDESPDEPVPPSDSAGTAIPPQRLDLPGLNQMQADFANGTQPTELTPEELAAQQEKYDLPPGARRLLSRIGPLTPATGGLPANAFGSSSGRFLATLMRETHAPLASRWASILLRRTLLSATNTPGDINGSDWAAERSWLLVRMGEADPARMMVQSVDSNLYTPRLHAVAMQVYLAAADPVGLCPIYQGALAGSSSPSWRMAEAICASFSAEQGRASAVLNQAQRRGEVRGIDYRLTEKIVGAGTNARRSVKIEWEGVDRLTAWRFGLATAANVDIPDGLMSQAGSHVRAWQARAPMLSLQTRLPSVETAARLGVFSSAALIDFYAELDSQDDTPATFRDRMDHIRSAYGAATAADRIEAMQDLWSMDQSDNFLDLLALSRAAAAVPVTDVSGEVATRLIAAMLSAGYDKSATRWAGSSALGQEDGVKGWALLAVGAPRPVVRIDGGRLRDYVAADGISGEMTLAGLAGLGRIGGEDLAGAAEGARLDLRPRTRWSRAIDLAGRRGEKGTVALLAAVGLQVPSWTRVPPEHLYHIVAALHRVGLDAEARMIAAEAIMRS
ncbi:MAG TPA: hypothetical protein VFX27_01865 [Sphingobium sp.]|nr:hypothetical protein [Sphingobium sp.]